ncbi:MAG: DNA polymerase I, partial [Rhodobacteraceae bacterium]|nr:DNA polymerase I [Paracoccaceae bacterium]
MNFGNGHHLHLIDGSAFIFRAFHALPPLTRKSDGLPIGAVSGFCNMLQRYMEGNTGQDAATHIAVIFDKGSHTFRNDLYDLYKANRDAMPEDLRPQMPLTRDATRAFNIACEEIEGYEADDIIATLACQARDAGGRVTIISSDKDLMQLVGGGVEMFDAMKQNRIDREGVHAKFGVYPDRVGLSRQLVQLDCNTPLDFTIDDLEIRDPDPDKLLNFLAEMEFRTLTKRVAERFGKDMPQITDAAPTTNAAQSAAVNVAEIAFDAEKYECVRDMAALQDWILRIYEVGYVAVDTETTSLNEMQAELVGISLSVKAGEACYIPLTHKANAADDLFGGAELAENQLSLNVALDALTPMLRDPSILKIGQNMKYDTKIFAGLGIDVAPIDDTMLMSYAMHGGLHNHGMDGLSERYLNHTPIPIKPLLGTGKSAITF